MHSQHERKRMKRAAAVTIASLFAALAQGAHAAQPDSWYVGVLAGRTHISNGCNGVSQAVQSIGYSTSNFNCSNSATAVGGLVGYQFDRHLGFEIGYTDFGKPSASGVAAGTPVSADVSPTAFNATLVWTQPIAAGFSVLGRLGLGITTVKTYASSPTASTSASAQSRTGVPGIGVEYDFGRIAARLIFDYYGKVGDSSTTGTTNLSLLSGGVTYSF